jgi:hypothetical protein
MVFYYFIQIIHYMFLSYDHLEVEIYRSEINMTDMLISYVYIFPTEYGRTTETCSG